MNEKRPVVDVHHGERIVDPFRWLEAGDAPEVAAWTAAQNAKTRAHLDGELRRAIHARLDELLSIGSLWSPAIRIDKAGKRRYFHAARSGKQDQPIVYVREGRTGKDRVLLDPKTLSRDETCAVDWWYPSHDGTKVAYGLSIGGDEQSTLFVRDVVTGGDLAEEIPRARMASVAWKPDGSGFLYTREPEPGSVPKGEEHYHRKLYEHRLGQHHRHDRLVWPPAGDTRWKMTDVPAADVSPSGRYLVVRIFHGWSRTSLMLKDLSKDEAPWLTLVTGVEALFDPSFHARRGADLLLVRTNEGAPNGKLVAIDPSKPEKDRWTTLVGEGADPIREFEAVGDTIFLQYLHKASSRLERRDLDGKNPVAIPLPVLGTASAPRGALQGDEAIFEVQSYGFPPALLRVDTKGKVAAEPFAKVEASIDASAIEVEQIEVASKDGTKISAFVVHRKGLPRDGSAPGILYGYGGFNIGQTPIFNRQAYAFLERGGVYCVANLRGGSEYGEAWHRGGMLDKKQNTFDDAIAVAEALVSERWVAKDRLGVRGGSNGGLLVGALVTQRPALFRAAVGSVPLLDMLRYHHFLIAKLWIPEYGSADDPVQYPWLRAYSPYHRVVEGTAYPATLWMTGEGDSRVDPLHARKMTAAMQEATSSGRPVLLRVEPKAGHGAGKPRHKQLEELADEWTFFFKELGLGA